MNDDTLTKHLPWWPPSWKICLWHAPKIPRYFAKFRGSCWPNGHLRGISRNFARNVMAERTLNQSCANVFLMLVSHWHIILLMFWNCLQIMFTWTQRSGTSGKVTRSDHVTGTISPCSKLSLIPKVYHACWKIQHIALVMFITCL